MNRYTLKDVWLMAIFLATSTWAFAQNSDPASFAIAASKIATENNGKGICTPPGTTLDNLMLPLRKYMSQHPEKQDLTEADIYQALSQGFPCPTNPSNNIDTLRSQGYSVRTISPIFGQLVMFSFPKGFTTVFEDAKGPQYIREAVLTGESTQKWSQMVTITGAKGIASNPNITPLLFASRMAGGFKNDCPTSFNGTGLGAFKLGNYDAFAALISCGVANPTGNLYSESTLLIVIRGESDYYTIQWAERGDASSEPIKFDKSKWMDRFKRLAPIKLCPIVPGEPAPYTSCIGGA
ncbi:Rap1a/Tai family immunity protein [Paludibacterium purpuratum]|nr:Rap1a/Tai family immunity protein [Paludibacterium purpuratum]